MKPSIHSLFLSALMLSAAPAAVIHTEDFNPTFDTNPKSFSSVLWNAHRGASAADVSSSTTSSYIITNSTGAGGVAGIGARIGLSEIGMAWTPGFTPVPLADLVSLSFQSNNNLTTDFSRITIGIDVGGSIQWFATLQTFGRDSAIAGTSSNFGTNGELESLSFTTAASAWRSVTFVPGSSLALGATSVSSLPSGTLAAVGILTENNAETMRFDQFRIEAVPEPSAVVAVVPGLLLMGGRRRR